MAVKDGILRLDAARIYANFAKTMVTNGAPEMRTARISSGPAASVYPKHKNLPAV